MDLKTKTRFALALALPAALIACAGPDDRAPSSPVARTCPSGNGSQTECTGSDRPSQDAAGRTKQAADRD